jgi:hypothetical protein
MPIELPTPHMRSGPSSHSIMTADNLLTFDSLLPYMPNVKWTLLDPPVVIPLHKDMVPIELLQIEFGLTPRTEGKVSNMDGDSILWDFGVKVLYQNFIHLVWIGEGPITIGDYTRVVVMFVRCEKVIH